MTRSDLFLLYTLARQLAADTHSEAIKEACLRVGKAAKARLSRLARDTRPPLYSPYYNPIGGDTTIGPDGVPFTYTSLAPTATGPHLGGGPLTKDAP